MDPSYCRNLENHLETHGVRCEPGLSPQELTAAEQWWGVRFPPDLAELLRNVVPAGPRFPNWRNLESPQLAESMEWPAEGICLRIKHGGFWLTNWGPKPQSAEEACRIARVFLAGAPPLIPVFGHRFIPADPRESGNPVFSVYQADVIHYGFDLPSYFHSEFGVGNPYSSPDVPREIEFWSELERRNG